MFEPESTTTPDVIVVGGGFGGSRKTIGIAIATPSPIARCRAYDAALDRMGAVTPLVTRYVCATLNSIVLSGRCSALMRPYFGRSAVKTNAMRGVGSRPDYCS